MTIRVHSCLFVVLFSFLLTASAQTEITWDVETSKNISIPRDIRRGESLTLLPRFLSYSTVTQLATNASIQLWYRSSDMSNGLYYVATGSVHSATGGIARIPWTSASCAAATNYTYDIVVRTNSILSNLRGFGTIRLLDGVYSQATTLTNPPTAWGILDWSTISNLNTGSAPFPTASSIATAALSNYVAAVALLGTNYADSVTNALRIWAESRAVASTQTIAGASVVGPVPAATWAAEAANSTNLDGIAAASYWTNGQTGFYWFPSGNDIYFTGVGEGDRTVSFTPSTSPGFAAWSIAFTNIGGVPWWQLKDESNNNERGFRMQGRFFAFDAIRNGGAVEEKADVTINGDLTVTGAVTVLGGGNVVTNFSSPTFGTLGFSTVDANGTNAIQAAQSPSSLPAGTIVTTGGTFSAGFVLKYSSGTPSGVVTTYCDAGGAGDFLADGSAPMTGPLNFGGQKGTNLANGAIANDAAALGQVWSGDLAGSNGIASLEAGVLGLTNRAISLEAGVLGLTNRAVSLESGVLGLTNRVVSLESGVLGLTNRAVSLESGVLDLTNRTVSLESGVLGLTNRAVSLEAGVLGLTNSVLSLGTSALWASNAINNVTNELGGGWYSTGANVTSLLFVAKSAMTVTQLFAWADYPGACTVTVFTSTYGGDFATGYTVASNIVLTTTGRYVNCSAALPALGGLWYTSGAGGATATNATIQVEAVQ